MEQFPFLHVLPLRLQPESRDAGFLSNANTSRTLVSLLLFLIKYRLCLRCFMTSLSHRRLKYDSPVPANTTRIQKARLTLPRVRAMFGTPCTPVSRALSFISRHSAPADFFSAQLSARSTESASTDILVDRTGRMKTSLKMDSL